MQITLRYSSAQEERLYTLREAVIISNYEGDILLPDPNAPHFQLALSPQDNLWELHLLEGDTITINDVDWDTSTPDKRAEFHAILKRNDVIEIGTSRLRVETLPTPSTSVWDDDEIAQLLDDTDTGTKAGYEPPPLTKLTQPKKTPQQPSQIYIGVSILAVSTAAIGLLLVFPTASQQPPPPTYITETDQQVPKRQTLFDSALRRYRLDLLKARTLVTLSMQKYERFPTHRNHTEMAARLMETARFMRASHQRFRSKLPIIQRFIDTLEQAQADPDKIREEHLRLQEWQKTAVQTDVTWDITIRYRDQPAITTVASITADAAQNMANENVAPVVLDAEVVP